MSLPFKNIVTNQAELRQYFYEISEANPDIKHFIFGDAERVVSEDRSRIEYPCLWLETPTIIYDLPKNQKKKLIANFVILSNSAPDDWNKSETESDKCAQIMNDVLQTLKEHSEGNIIRLEKSSRLKAEPINGFAHDYDIGFRGEATFDVMLVPSVENEKWQSVCPLGTLAKFHWQNNEAGNFTNCVVTNESLPTDEVFVVEWKYQVDNQAVVTVEDAPNVTINAAGKTAQIQLKITKDECVRYAHIAITNEKNVGFSIPTTQQQKL